MRPPPLRDLLRLQWMMTAVDDNSGIFVAFPNPEKEDYVNTANAGADLSVAGLEWRRI